MCTHYPSPQYSPLAVLAVLLLLLLHVRPIVRGVDVHIGGLTGRNRFVVLVFIIVNKGLLRHGWLCVFAINNNWLTRELKETSPKKTL